MDTEKMYDMLDTIYLSQMAAHGWFTAKQAHALLPESSLKEVYDALQWAVIESRDKMAQLVRNRDKYSWIVKH